MAKTKTIDPELLELKRQELKIKEARLLQVKEAQAERKKEREAKKIEKEEKERKKAQAQEYRREKVEAHTFAASALPKGSIEQVRQEVYAELVKKNSEGDQQAREILKTFLLEQFHIVTARSDKNPAVYLWNSDTGIYENNGVMRLQAVIEEILGPAYKIKLVNDVIERIKVITQEDANEMRRVEDPYRIVVGNGVLNVLKGTLDAFSPYPREFTRIPTNYNPDAKTEDLEAFFKSCDLNSEEITTIYEIGAWCLVRNYSIAKIVFLYGPGRNGKDVTLTILRNMLGEENCSALPVDTVTLGFQLVDLADSLANLSTESPNQISMNGVKKLTGEGLFSADVKHGATRKFVNYAKLINATNEIPELSESTYAAYARINNIPYRKKRVTRTEYDKLTPEQQKGYGVIDPSIDKKKHSVEWREAYLKLAVKAAPAFFERGDFANHKSIEETQRLWEERANDVSNFWEGAMKEAHELVKETPEAENATKIQTVDKALIYAQYSSYCSDVLDTHAKSENAFWRKVSEVVRLDKINYGERLDANKKRIKVIKYYTINENFWKPSSEEQK